MESGRPSHSSGVPEVARLLEGKDLDMSRNIHSQTASGPGANTDAGKSSYPRSYMYLASHGPR